MGGLAVGAGAIGDLVLYNDSGLYLPTTTTGEDVLKEIAIPANLIGPADPYSGFEVLATIGAAANTTAKTARLRVGGIGGVIIMIQASSVSGVRVEFGGMLQANSANSLDGQGFSGISSGGSVFFGTAALAGLNFAAPLLVTVTGQSAAPGNLFLTSMRVVLFRKVK